VYAADTNPEFLEFIRNTAATKGLSNVVTILATEGGPNLPENSIDIVFMRNVYHHLQDRVKYLGRLTSLLRRGGKIAVVEYRRSSAFSFRGLFRHYVPVEVITREMAEAGYKLDQSYDFLPDQSFMMFSLNRQDTDSQSASSN
jgi:ubiquinone/menaquinone biosynthesis C-methylase UbiE